MGEESISAKKSSRNRSHTPRAKCDTVQSSQDDTVESTIDRISVVEEVGRAKDEWEVTFDAVPDPI